MGYVYCAQLWAPSVNGSPVTQIVAQLLSFPLGRLWAWLMPRVKIFGVALNPGPFTVKEHVLITVMATVGYQSAYAVRTLFAMISYTSDENIQTDIIAVQRVYYHQVYSFGYQWMVVMSTQLVWNLTHEIISPCHKG